MSRIIIFAGTTEGRELAEFFSRQKVKTEVCVATEYGGQLLGEDAYRIVHAGRMDASAMEMLIGASFENAGEPVVDTSGNKEVLVVDATHPYAAEVSQNIRQACLKSKVEYIRLLRESMISETQNAGKSKLVKEAAADSVVFVDSVQDAVEYLGQTTGNILVTTGSKELNKFTALPDYAERVYARVLSTPEVAAACAGLGFTGKHLICMQGPFSEELNTAMLRQFDAKWLVTKESGKTGGFEEKLHAAQKAGARVVLIGRPTKEEGMSPLEVRAYLIKKLNMKVKRQIAVVGIGMGNLENLTIEAKTACEEAQLIMGAPRMLESFADTGAAMYFSYRPEDMKVYMDEHPEYEKIALLQSGDVGFYSGAKRIYEVFAEEEMQVYPGISSVVYLCAKLRTSWEDAKLISLHGRTANVIAAIRQHKKVFALMSRGESVSELCEKLKDYGMGDLLMTVAEKLSYPDECIRTKQVQEFLGEDFEDLCVVLLENPKAQSHVTHGIADEAFLRGKVPMTKSEVRSISLSKLGLRSNAIIYDVGAGTGSVSIEAALQASDGWVYAIEKKQEAATLIRANSRKFAVDNITVIEGMAPEALDELPAPTHVFIGGSSGNLRQIMEAVLQKNPSVRIVINCIALETLSETLKDIKELSVMDEEIVSVSVAKSSEVGSYHMMMGQNPVYIISMTGAVV